MTDGRVARPLGTPQGVLIARDPPPPKPAPYNPIMASYSFDRFCRNLRFAERSLLPLRLSGWLEWDKDFERATSEGNEILEAVCAAMSPTERADPSTIGFSRRLEIADAAKISDCALDSVFDCYECATQRHQSETKQWQEMVLLASLWASLPLLFVANGCRLLFQKLRTCWRSPKESI